MYLSPAGAAPTSLLHTARLASVICTVGTIYLIFRLTYRLFQSEAYALGVAAFVALIPQFTYTGAYVGDDAYLILAVTGTMWATVRGMQAGWTLRNKLLMGLALALVSLGKQNGWIAALPFALLAASSAWRTNWRQTAQTWALMYLPACITLGSWLARNWLLYHDPLALRIGRVAWQDYVTRIGHAWIPLAQRGRGFLHLLFRTPWLVRMFESFWGRFFYMSVPMDRPIYLTLLGASLAGMTCTGWALWKRRDVLFTTEVTARVLGCAALSLVLLFVSTAFSSLHNDFQPQGRYFFPLIAPLAIVITLGVYVISRRSQRWLRMLPFVGLALLLALNVFSLAHYVYAHPYPEIPLPRF
jgi:4-amino-4-deoxy-L-arabinose transferase-like glycosyltransferase